MRRTRTRRRKDKRVFRQTKDRTQSINVKPIVMRGGTRL